VQAPVVVAAGFAVDLDERVEPHPRLAAVADADLEHVELIGQRPPLGEPIPNGEQPRDRVARRRRVERVALAARQRLFVRPPRHRFPQTERFPVERVEAPDQARRRAAPRFEMVAVRFVAPRERPRHLGVHVVLGAARAPQIDADLEAVRGRCR